MINRQFVVYKEVTKELLAAIPIIDDGTCKPIIKDGIKVDIVPVNDKYIVRADNGTVYFQEPRKE